MVASPFKIYIDGAEVLNYTTAALNRKKDDLTGQLSFTLFMSYVPGAPVMRAATTGAEITAYVGGQLAFTGIIDKRTGNGEKSVDSQEASAGGVGGDSGEQLRIGPNEYKVTINARGKTKYLINSSHQHPTTNILQPTTRDALQELIAPFNIDLEWLGKNTKLDKVRFRDGARVLEEIHRLGNENGHYIYETRDGKLRVTDDTGQVTGEPIILGHNILQFSAGQSEERVNSEVQVKGQRTPKGSWGRKAVKSIIKEVADSSVKSYSPLILQHYGDGTEEALERRAKFESDKRASTAKRVNVTVFHVQTNGEPWDIGTLHYIEVPPEGIFDIMECIELTYNVDAKGALNTQMILAPPPSAGVSGSGSGGLSGLTNAAYPPELLAFGASRRAAAGIPLVAGQFPDPWTGAALSVIIPPIVKPSNNVVLDHKPTPPIKLPPGAQE